MMLHVSAVADACFSLASKMAPIHLDWSSSSAHWKRSVLPELLILMENPIGDSMALREQPATSCTASFSGRVCVAQWPVCYMCITCVSHVGVRLQQSARSCGRSCAQHADQAGRQVRLPTRHGPRRATHGSCWHDTRREPTGSCFARAPGAGCFASDGMACELGEQGRTVSMYAQSSQAYNATRASVLE